jgi:ferrous iron transport protein A
MVPIAQFKEGKTGIIADITGSQELIKRLYSMGIRPGVKVKKLSAMRNKGPVVIVCGATQVALGRNMADKIMVSEDNGNEKSCGRTV